MCKDAYNHVSVHIYIHLNIFNAPYVYGVEFTSYAGVSSLPLGSSENLVSKTVPCTRLSGFSLGGGGRGHSTKIGPKPKTRDQKHVKHDSRDDFWKNRVWPKTGEKVSPRLSWILMEVMFCANETSMEKKKTFPKKVQTCVLRKFQFSVKRKF